MRWKCGCAYDGTDFEGWQIQGDRPSVQSSIEDALEEIFKKRVSIVGSGRTDAGVHALEQVFHFDFDWAHGPLKLQRAMGTKFPEAIRPLWVKAVEDDFHSRFSAHSKRYFYQLHLGRASPFDSRYCWSTRERLDVNAMRAALPYLIGKHDFAAFAANRGKEYESTERTIMDASATFESGFLKLSFEADGFMYKMVRSLVGCLVNVASGRLSPEDFGELLESKKRSPLVYAAPPQGLFLEKVFY